MKFFNRPISPHLSIYIPQISSLFSIWHRITSVYVFLYLLLYIIIHKIMLILSFSAYYFTNLLVPFIFLLNYLLFISLYYHFLNGIKYIFWHLDLFSNKLGLTNLSLIICTIILSSQVLFFKNYFL